MKQLSHYFPFFILTMLIYGVFFYYHKQSLIVPIPLHSGQQAVQLQFVELTEAVPAEVPDDKLINKEPQAEKEEAKKLLVKKAAKDADLELTKAETKPEKTETDSDKQSQIKIAKQALQKAIEETSAIHDATLKAELFETDYQLAETDAITETASKKATTESANKQSKPAKELDTPTPKKSKPVFKMSPKQSSASTENPGVLQEAVVVSGNIPVYPKRAILRNQQGRVVVKLTVTTKGRGKDPKIMASSGHSILDNAILNFIREEFFLPATKGKEKISSEQIFAFRFQLK